MTGRKKQLKVLLADDDRSIARIYKVGLPRCFEVDSEPHSESLKRDPVGEQDRIAASVSITVCSQGAAAIELFEQAMQCDDPFDVIVLDIRMPPGMSGIDAAEKIRTLDPRVPIIFVSGYSDLTILDLQKRVPPPSRMRFIEKPIQLTQLAALIREVASAA